MSEINKNKYQIFICTSPASFPFSFARHPYIVCNEKGKISRYEVLYFKVNNKNLNKNYYSLKKPFRGVEVILGVNNFLYWRGKVIYKFEGVIAKKMIFFVKESLRTYPYLGKYKLSGPNSNTYVQWVLDNFPETKASLPWNCFGKNYLNKK